MADYSYSSLAGYINLDLLRAASQEDRRGVAGDLTETLAALAEYERRIAALEDLAQKIMAAA